MAREVLGDSPGAIQDYRQALEIESDEATYVRRGWLLAADSPKEALHDFQEAVKLNPDNREALAGLGYTPPRSAGTGRGWSWWKSP